MKVGDLVQVPAEAILGPVTLRAPAEYGVVMGDHSPTRLTILPRIVDVLWNDGELEEFWSGDLMVISEHR